MSGQITCAWCTAAATCEVEVEPARLSASRELIRMGYRVPACEVHRHVPADPPQPVKRDRGPIKGQTSIDDFLGAA